MLMSFPSRLNAANAVRTYFNASVRKSSSQSTPATPFFSVAWWMEHAAVMSLAGGAAGAVIYIGTSVGSVRTQVQANAEMLKASLQLSREMNAEQIKASRELNAEQIKASRELNAVRIKAWEESNAKLLEASILQLGEKARLIAENESLKTHREYSVRHVHVIRFECKPPLAPPPHMR